MMWRGDVASALTNLRSAKWRSLLTMLGVIIGVSSVVTIISLGDGLKQQITGQINMLGSDVLTIRSGKLIGGTGSNANNLNLVGLLNASNLTAADVTALTKLPSVNAVVPFDFISNSVRSTDSEIDSAYVLGTTQQMPDLLKQGLAYGSFPRANPSENYAVIGSNIAQQLYGQLNPVGHSITIKGQNFIVGGVLSPSTGGILSVAETDFNSAVFIPFDTALKINSNQTNILQILAQVKAGYTLDQASADIQTALQQLHGHNDFSVLRQDQLLDVAGNVINRITAFVSSIAAIALLVGGIGIMDIMLVSVSERTREIGIRKAVGATNRQILTQFLIEGCVLTIGGGIIGIIISLLINVGLRVYTNWQPVVSPLVMLLAVGVTAIVGIVFSATPALKAARKDPIDALRV